MSTKKKGPTKLKVVDIFSGCGGLSLGFQNAGFKVVAAYDNWELANSVYKKNHKHDVHLFDLSEERKVAKHISQYAPEVIIGGPPCQDFSIAGKRLELQRANLTVSFAKIVSLVSPKLAVMENVYSIEKSQSLKAAIEVLKKNGYGITTRVIDASLTGVPQKRRRFFMVAAKGFPDDAFGLSLDEGLADRAKTIAEYFGNKLEIEYYYAHPRSYKRRAVFSIHEPSATIRRVNRPIPKTYVRHPADKAKITAAIRPLTITERLQVQTFPTNYILSGSMSQQEHLVANAVPVKLAEYVAKQVKKTLNRISKRSPLAR